IGPGRGGAGDHGLARTLRRSPPATRVAGRRRAGGGPQGNAQGLDARAGRCRRSPGVRPLSPGPRDPAHGPRDRGGAGIDAGRRSRRRLLRGRGLEPGRRGHTDPTPTPPRRGGGHAAMNVLTLEVLWNRLLSVVNEQQVTLLRTAFSTVVRESQDLACGVFDTRGYMIAQSLTGTPGHINAMATGVRHFLQAYPPETLQPGYVP